MAEARGEDWELRVLREHDLEALMEVRNDPDVQDALVGTNLTMDEVGARTWLSAYSNDPHRYLRVIAVDGRAVGYASVVVTDALRGAGTYNVVVGRSEQGRGLGRAATEHVLATAFDRLGLRRVELQVLASNERARRLYAALGFVDEGCRRQAAFKRGAHVDVLLMGLLRDDWEHRALD